MVGETKKEAIKMKKEAVKTKTSSCRGHPVHMEAGRAGTPSTTQRPRVTAHPSHTTVGTGCPR